MGIFEVSTVDYEINPRQIKILGTGTSFSGSLKAPVNRSFENKTLDQILGAFAADAGIETAIDADLGKIELPFLNQTKSPLHVLHELERRFDAVAKFENKRLIFTKRDEGQSASGQRTPLLVLQPWNVSQGFVRHTTRADFGRAKVGWFDADHIKRYAEHGDGDESRPAFLSGQIARNEAEAKAMAKSQLSGLKRSTGEVHLTLSKGDPWVRDQTQILVKGFRSKIDGSYVIDTVTHTYVKDAGILSTILAKPPGDGADYTSLNDGDFFKLGTGGVVGDVGPQLPDPTKGPVGGTPSPAPVEDVPPVPVPDEPVNT